MSTDTGQGPVGQNVNYCRAGGKAGGIVSRHLCQSISGLSRPFPQLIAGLVFGRNYYTANFHHVYEKSLMALGRGCYCGCFVSVEIFYATTCLSHPNARVMCMHAWTSKVWVWLLKINAETLQATGDSWRSDIGMINNQKAKLTQRDSV